MKKPKKTTKKVVAKKRKAKPRTLTITSPVDSSLSVVVASEMADDELIEQEMMGEVLPFFVYRFPQEGKEVVGLTTKGVNEVVRRLNKNPKSGSKIHINPKYLIKEEVEREGEKGIEVSVFAEDLVSGGSAWGVKFEPYMKLKRDGSKIRNTFAVEKALSKAERNAKRKLISEVMATKMIDKLVKENPSNVKTIEAPKFLQTVVVPARPQASSPEELKTVIITAIKQAKSSDKVIDLDDKAKVSPKLTQEMKDEIHKVATSRVDELDNTVK